ncbi:transglycosylase SLT domain-containing protein [Bordetella pseudohinzii]|uniref:Membrane-bound lytic transglycosylase F n=2 Tax=Bordetella pseudohinzii TaxID=1331258 RepID=A0A0M7D0P3_9BORD|nr:transglycosylase SLT domain-containing protein [Bordetella pseudohinzii]CUI46306.1 membrane-bound lytic transglycosylase F [Bordetella pseudohinzii]
MMRRLLRRAWSGAVLLAIASCAVQPVPAAEVPQAALKHRSELTRNARTLVGMDAPVPMFAAQIHQESRWRSNARSPVGAQGMAQFMPATAEWIAGLFPALASNDPYNPSWAMRALVTYDLWLYERIRAASACQRWAFALSAYNGGLGWVNRDKKLASSKGLDPLVWFGSVEQVNAGRSAANWRENRDYPKRILYHHQPTYIQAGWGLGVCS